MTFTFYQIITVILMHFVFDFIFQSHWMASNKSKSNKALGAHVTVYSIGLIIIAMNYNLSLYNSFLWVSFNTVAHFITDYFTSRASSKRFGNNWHDFFCVVGADQVIHYLTIFGSLKLITDYLQ